MAVTKLSSKFVNDNCCICEFCQEPMVSKRITTNAKHLYNIGQVFECPCGKGKLWTNSIRNEDEFIAFAEGKRPNYRHGFCNDKKCGHCGSDVVPYKNGVMMFGQRGDRYGCKRCNPPIGGDYYATKAIVVFGNLWPEGSRDGGATGGQMLEQWYKNKLPMLKQVHGEWNAPEPLSEKPMLEKQPVIAKFNLRTHSMLKMATYGHGDFSDRKSPFADPYNPRRKSPDDMADTMNTPGSQALDGANDGFWGQQDRGEYDELFNVDTALQMQLDGVTGQTPSGAGKPLDTISSPPQNHGNGPYQLQDDAITEHGQAIESAQQGKRDVLKDQMPNRLPGQGQVISPKPIRQRVKRNAPIRRSETIGPLEATWAWQIKKGRAV